MDYRQSGVDIDAANETVRRIKSLARTTFTRHVLSEIGSFGGLFRLDRDRYREPVLVSSADGVGTKLKVAFLTGRHDTVGADLVNHCVNDILVQGAEPLFFLDYLATGRLAPTVAEQVVGGIAGACRDVDRERIVDGRKIAPGDAVIGLPSAGLHTNGYSLARRVLFELSAFAPETFVSELCQTVGDALLAPHLSYLAAIRPLLPAGLIKGMAHITGGGITENLPRVLPEGCTAVIHPRTWNVPPIFSLLQQRGDITTEEMFRTFNMGLGLIVICADLDADRAIGLLQKSTSTRARRIGQIEPGPREVRYI